MRASVRLAGLAACIITIGWFLYAHLYSPQVIRLELPECHDTETHDISDLITNATTIWEEILGRQTNNVAQAATEYRNRRGRHPPPGFEVWHERAVHSGVVIVEDFFDQIYHDLELFWGIQPSDIRASVSTWLPILQVRDGQVVQLTEGRARSKSWAEFVGRTARDLPDMDLALNGLDEPSVIASWKTVDNAVYHASIQAKRMGGVTLAGISQTFGAHRENKQSPAKGKSESHARWSTKRDDFHKAIREACPHSALRNSSAEDIYDQPVQNTAISFAGNVTSQKDICENPKLIKSHGYLMSPDSINFTTSPIPIFSTAKTSVNNDILLPDPAYYEDMTHSGNDFWGDWSSTYPWNEKSHGLIWRGAGTGGSACVNEYSDYHRHRFVARLNATSIDNHDGSAPDLSSWLSEHADVSFTKLLCDKITSVADHFSVAEPIKMRTQYKWKYLPDIDGNALSGRFRAFMRSNSAVIKATIFTEWHDARLMPWKHYIPLEMSFESLYDGMKFFLGYPGQCAHDREGERIAREGREWAESAMRKEDMLIYVHRLLLEYARIVDDDRDRSGYVQDLLDAGR